MPSFTLLVLFSLSIMVTFRCYQGVDAGIVIKADQTLIDNICKQSQDYNYCQTTLSNDPRTGTADTDGLALISIALTSQEIQDTSEKIPGIMKEITDTVGKQRLGVCQSDYSDSLVNFRGAFTSASAKSYWDVINWVRDGTNKVIDCEDIYRRTDPIGVSPITVNNHNVIKLSEIILIIVDSLLPH